MPTNRLRIAGALERAPDGQTRNRPSGWFEPLAAAPPQLRAELIAQAHFRQQLHARALEVTLRGAAFPGGSGIEEDAHRNPVQAQRRHHEVPVDVRYRRAPLDRPEARTMPCQDRFAAEVAAQRKLALIEHG